MRVVTIETKTKKHNEEDVTANSSRYFKSSKIMAEIDELAALSPRQVVARIAQVRNGKESGYSQEALVYFTRRLHQDGRDNEAWSIAKMIAQRCRAKITSVLRLWRLDSAQEYEDIASEMFTQLFDAIFNLTPSSEFWEVRFWICFDRRLIKIVRRRRNELNKMASVVEHNPSDEQDESENMIDRLQSSRPEDSPITYAMIADALTVLPGPIRTAFLLKHLGQMNEETGEPNIASILGVTGRTVRNYLKRAEANLAKWRSESENGVQNNEP